MYSLFFFFFVIFSTLVFAEEQKTINLQKSAEVQSSATSSTKLSKDQVSTKKDSQELSKDATLNLDNPTPNVVQVKDGSTSIIINFGNGRNVNVNPAPDSNEILKPVINTEKEKTAVIPDNNKKINKKSANKKIASNKTNSKKKPKRKKNNNIVEVKKNEEETEEIQYIVKETTVDEKTGQIIDQKEYEEKDHEKAKKEFEAQNQLNNDAKSSSTPQVFNSSQSLTSASSGITFEK